MALFQRTPFGFTALAIGLVIILSQSAVFAQTDTHNSIPKTVPGKDQAVGSVAITTIDGWSPFISTDGRFRILFPSSSNYNNDVISVHQFTSVSSDVKWMVTYSDLDVNAGTQSELREQYARVSRPTAGKRLLWQTDVFLHGILGMEFAEHRGSELTIWRVFQVGRRVYFVTANSTASNVSRAELDGKYKQFFDSFTFWQ